MSIVASLSKQQQGSGISRDYSISLSKLKCFTEDVYRGISPNENALDFNPEPPVFACRFSTTPGYENFIALANEDGKIALQDTTERNGGSEEKLQGSQAHNNAIFDICWMPGEMKLVTASGDHSARLWDVSLSGITELASFNAHIRSIKSAVFKPNDKAVFATGARDGAIMVWDIRANHLLSDGSSRPKPDNIIMQAHYNPSKVSKRRSKTPTSASKNFKEQSVTALIFQDEHNLLSASTNDGMIKMWDLRKNYSTYKREPIAKSVINHGGKSGRNGYTSMSIDPSGNKLFASCMDHTIYAYNLNSYSSEPIAEYYGHENRTFYVKACLSPDGEYVASGSSDENAYIWKVNQPGIPIFKLTGHREEVTCIAWCSIGESKIVTCSDDSMHRVWRVNTEEVDDDRAMQLRGFAEPIINLTLNHRLEKCSVHETTPTMRKAYLSEYSSGSDITPGSETPAGSIPGSLNKRNYAQAFRTPTVLSPIVENLEGSSSKRPHLESSGGRGGARRLFSPSRREDRHTLGCTITCYDEPDQQQPGPSSTEKLTFSPTCNLPNFVVDGTAPHLLERSPNKSKENVDWLTRIRKERYELSALSDKSSPNSQIANKRRRSLSMEPSRKSTSKEPPSPLLRFFKTAIKHADKI